MEEVPSVTVGSGEEGGGPVACPAAPGAQKTVRFQCGLLRETETFSEEDLEDVSLVALLEYVEEMINGKVGPSSCCVRVLCRLAGESE